VAHLSQAAPRIQPCPETETQRGIQPQSSDRLNELETENALLQGRVRDLETHTQRLHTTVLKLSQELEAATTELRDNESPHPLTPVQNENQCAVCGAGNDNPDPTHG